MEESQSDEETEVNEELSVSQSSSPARDTGDTPAPESCGSSGTALAPTAVPPVCRPKMFPRRKGSSSAAAAASDRELLAAIAKCDNEDKVSE